MSDRKEILDLVDSEPRNTEADFAATLGLGRSAKGPSRTKWIVISALIIAVLAGGTFVWFRFFRHKPVQFVTAPAKRGDLTVNVTATGTLQPVNMVDVGAEISGRIERVSADFNMLVKKGDPLLEIDTRQLRSQVERSQASLEVAEASVKQADASFIEASLNWDRNNELFKANLISSQELDSSRAALARTDAAVASAKAQVTVASAGLNADRTNLEKAVVRSPIDGIVLARRVEPGQTVASSFQTPLLFKLAESLARMELHVNVDEADMGLVKEEQHASFAVDAHPNHMFSAIITSLRNDPQTVQGVVSYEAVLTVDNSDGLLRPGMTATASITTESRTNVLLVPNAALRFNPPLAIPAKSSTTVTTTHGAAVDHKVWIQRNEKPASVTVTKGLTDGRFTEILEGEIKAGDPLLVDVMEARK